MSTDLSEFSIPLVRGSSPQSAASRANFDKGLEHSLDGLEIDESEPEIINYIETRLGAIPETTLLLNLPQWNFLEADVGWPHLFSQFSGLIEQTQARVISWDIQAYLPPGESPSFPLENLRKTYPYANFDIWNPSTLSLMGHMLQARGEDDIIRQTNGTNQLRLRRCDCSESPAIPCPLQVDSYDRYLSYLVPFGYQLVLPSGDTMQYGDKCLLEDFRGSLWAMPHPENCRVYIRIVFGDPRGFSTYNNDVINDITFADILTKVDTGKFQSISAGTVASYDSYDTSFDGSETLVGEKSIDSYTCQKADFEEDNGRSFNDVYDYPSETTDESPLDAKKTKDKRQRVDGNSDGKLQEMYPDISIGGVVLSNSRRVPNCFLLFRTWYSKTMKQEDPTVQNIVISRSAAESWHNISAIEKQAWIERAATLRVLHRERHPEYTYAPRKSNEIKRRRRHTEEDLPQSKRVRISVDAPTGKRKLYKDPDDPKLYPPAKRQNIYKRDQKFETPLLENQQIAKQYQKVAIANVEDHIFGMKLAEQNISQKRRCCMEEDSEGSSQSIKRRTILPENKRSSKGVRDNSTRTYHLH